VLAEDWQRQGRPFAGLIVGRSYRMSVGKFVTELEVVAKASEEAEWMNQIARLP